MGCDSQFDDFPYLPSSPSVSSLERRIEKLEAMTRRQEAKYNALKGLTGDHDDSPYDLEHVAKMMKKRKR